ncbi:MAG: aspartate aminotransferase family protein [Anaerolineae bacterium]|nr:aminotransferase class V-fold PLP-dependent enzyme [Anaerolineales bacterium]MCQ3975205.1 aspartate aminotransferase family protein [Anaerolineae bacterium]
MKTLLELASARASDYLEKLSQRQVSPSAAALARLQALDHSLPDEPTDPAEVLTLLDEIGSPATVASAGGRYFGFVSGGSLPAALAANWLAGAWDQPADMVAASPIGAKLEEVAGRWLLELLGLPPQAAVGFVTGATMANLAGLAAARHALLRRLGWDVEGRGLFGAPELRVVVGDEAHVSLLKALSLLGLGRERVSRVPVDGQGRMRPDAMPHLTERTILCLQAGNVNTGAFDPAPELCAAARQAGAWVHVDGAFGLWAAAAPNRAALTTGFIGADSWAVSAHHWLNVPYDSGLVICRQEESLRAAMSFSAAYLTLSEQREPGLYTPEMSRRARGVEIWAALRSLGRSGLADLIERSCRYAARLAEGLSAAGYLILNEVVLNQVLVSFGEADKTRRVIAALQEESTCWCGGTVWQGQPAMQISVSSWATTEADVEQCLRAILRVVKEGVRPES